MQQKLKTILEESKKQLERATSLKEAEETRIKVLGKKGALTEILRSMGGLSPEERKELGQAANQVRAEIEKALAETVAGLKEKAREARFKAETIDVTEPGKRYELGTKHPITITMEEISKIFKSMGFSLTEGPEVEKMCIRDRIYAGLIMLQPNMSTAFTVVFIAGGMLIVSGVKWRHMGILAGAATVAGVGLILMDTEEMCIRDRYTEEEMAAIEGNYTIVPDVVGKEYSEAAGIIAGQNLGYTKRDGANEDFIVAAQYPAAGTKVKRGSSVYVYDQ